MVEAIGDDLGFIRAALAEAELPPLLPALACATGDLSLLRSDLRTDPELALEEQGGLTPEQQERTRALAEEALIRFRDNGSVPAALPGAEDLRRIMAWATGEGASSGQLSFLEEELALGESDLRSPGWHKDEIDAERPFLVAIIGAGMSGILAAHRLEQAGVPYVILEKNDDVGGTWLENTYPGCRVDVTNHAYSYSFAQRSDWPAHYSPQQVLLDYFRACADEFGVLARIRFRTEVVSATFDDSSATWWLRVRTGEGEEELEANAVISAVGQLNRPKMPGLAGMDSFAGVSFHSSNWDQSLDLTGKRVAVIGTGASAIQLIPAIAAQVADLTILQRTPNWFYPDPRYHQAVSEGLMWLFHHVPTYTQWYRFWQFWQGTETLLAHCRVDRGWPSQERSVSALNDLVRELLTGYLEGEFAGRPDLSRKVVPKYPPSAKRILIDDGTWAQALKRPNVHLVTDKIETITPTGLRTADGTEHALDVIVYATGFHASRFLMPMRVTGRRGVDLNEQWAGNARAYLGITVPNFPNLFLLYGPNTNIVINGTTIFFAECEAHYIQGCLRLLLEGRFRAMDPRAAVHDEYNARIDEGNANMVWGASTVNSWYKNEFGRTAQNWPFGLLEYWTQTRAPSHSDYELL